VDVEQKKRTNFEVKGNACTGKIAAIIPGG
jgi:hypothetical protein